MGEIIPRKLYYLLSLIFIFALPVIGAGIAMRSYISWTSLIIFILTIVFLGSIWDIWATRHGKRDSVWLWQFNFRDNLGIKIFGLPIEEYLFYVFASVYAVFIWEALGLALQTKDSSYYILVVSMGAWSLIFAILPYLFKKSGDRL